MGQQGSYLRVQGLPVSAVHDTEVKGTYGGRRERGVAVGVICAQRASVVPDGILDQEPDNTVIYQPEEGESLSSKKQ